MNGSVIIGNGGETCGATYAGAIRYNGGTMEFCNGTSWAAIGGGASASSVAASAGTAVAPSISFSGDPNTGFYSAGADQIGVAANGANIFTMSSSGLVANTAGGGVVTTAAGTAAAPTFSFAGDPDTGWYHPAANTLAAATGGAERVRIDSSGNIGIGTTNPLTRLHLDNGDTGGENFRSFRHVGSNNWSNINRYYQSRGTASAPTSTVNGDFLVSFNLGGYDGSAYQDSASIAAVANGTITSGSIPTDLLFYTGSSGGGSEKVRITSDGNVGIGTTNPTAKLEVAGTIVSQPQSPAGSTLDLAAGNTHIVSIAGGSTVTLQNMKDGGQYTILMQDTTARTYTFSGCTTSYFKPANASTTNGTQSVYGIITIKNGANWLCYITWASGFTQYP